MTALTRSPLPLSADQLVELGGVTDRVEAEYSDLARVGVAQSDHALHGGGLACPVRSEDPEDLALGHRVAVDLAQVRHVQGRPGAVERRHRRWFPGERPRVATTNRSASSRP
jgi:hypothetical protein